MQTLDKIRKLRSSRPQGGGGSRLRGIFHSWKDGDNIVRLVGEFLETKTHFIAPAPKRGERGLCQTVAFQGNEKMPQVINCLDWDVLKEEGRRGGCPICRLHAIAQQVLNDQCTDEEKKLFEKLRRDTAPRTLLKWNIIDRDDPHVLAVDDGNERKVLGFKIASIGMEAWGDIEGVFDQMGFDISDVEDGLDICVTKGHNGTRTEYSAAACIDKSTKPPSAKVTPLTAEEKQLVRHDLKQVCGKYVDAKRIMDALHEDYRDLLEVNASEDDEPAVEDAGPDEEAARKAAAAAAAASPKVVPKAAPVAPKAAKAAPKVAPSAVSAEETPAGDEEAAAATAAVAEDDGDGLAPQSSIPIRKISRTPVGRGSVGN